jgi:hypothetical protein
MTKTPSTSSTQTAADAVDELLAARLVQQPGPKGSAWSARTGCCNG